MQGATDLADGTAWTGRVGGTRSFLGDFSADQRPAGTDDARELLAPVYSRFTEGFETTDLKTAKALVDNLQRH